MSEHMRRFGNDKWQTNPLLTTKSKITVGEPRIVKKSPPMKLKPTMKQYGDKGYKPSNGMGVGY